METDGFIFNTRRKGQKGFRKAQKEYIPEDRSQVTEKDVEKTMAFVQSRVVDFANKIASIISSHFSSNAKIVQLQMYGMGAIDNRFTSGSYQMGVAFELLKCFRKNYPACSATYQELIVAPGEIAYLNNHDIKVLNECTFDDSHFREAESNFSKNTSQSAVLVCYMIHGHWTMLNAFLAAHWTASQLSRIIIIGNSLQNVASTALLTKIPPRILAFAKVCKENSIDQFMAHSIELHFTQTAVISVTYEIAIDLVANFKD